MFGFDFDGWLMLSHTHDEWIGIAGGMLMPALASLCLAIDDVNSHVDLSEELTTDIVWFMARSSTLLILARLDSTRALPVMSV